MTDEPINLHKTQMNTPTNETQSAAALDARGLEIRSKNDD